MVGSPSRLSIIAPATGSATDDEQVARHLVERIGTVGGANADVLDARAVSPFDIDAGFDAERVADLECVVVARDHEWILVALEPNTVARAMDEQLTHARISDHRPCRGIDLLALDARPNRVARRLLRALENFVQSGEIVARPGVGVPGHPERTRDVGAVARDGAADVEDDGFASLNDPIGRLGVRRPPGGLRGRWEQCPGRGPPMSRTMGSPA